MAGIPVDVSVFHGVFAHETDRLDSGIFGQGSVVHPFFYKERKTGDSDFRPVRPILFFILTEEKNIRKKRKCPRYRNRTSVSFFLKTKTWKSEGNTNRVKDRILPVFADLVVNSSLIPGKKVLHKRTRYSRKETLLEDDYPDVRFFHPMCFREHRIVFHFYSSRRMNE